MLKTSYDQLSCEQFLIANNGFASQLLPDIAVRSGRGQVLITSPIEGLKVKGTFYMAEGFYYFRNLNDRLLFGRARHIDFETEHTTKIALNQKI